MRESKDYSQENMAAELNITTSAYSKIERGVTDPSIGRLAEIAGILEVEIAYFFQDLPAKNNLEDKNKMYGFATKSDIEELSNIIKQLKQELTQLKKEVLGTTTVATRKSRKKA